MLNQEKMLKEQIDELIVAQNKDRLLIYSLVEILIGYLNNVKYNEKNIKYQNDLMATISERFDIYSQKDLFAAMDEATDFLKEAYFKVSGPDSGRVH